MMILVDLFNDAEMRRCWWQEPLGRIAVPHHFEHVPQQPQHYTADQQFYSVSPRRQIHHDNGCQDNGRPAPPGRLVRSRSDETLSNVSLLPPRRPTTVRRRKKTVADAAECLINDFNDGKEIDLDKLTARPGVGTGSFEAGVGRSSKPTESGAKSTHANVQNWLETQNDVGSSSKWAGPGSKYHLIDVHHLWTSCIERCRRLVKVGGLDSSKWAGPGSKYHLIDVQHLWTSCIVLGSCLSTRYTWSGDLLSCWSGFVSWSW